MVPQDPQRREIFVGRGDEHAQYQKFLLGEEGSGFCG